MIILAGIAGLTLAIGLIAYFGLPAVFAAVTAAGWGVLAVTAYHAVSLFFSTLAWQALLKRYNKEGIGFGYFFFTRTVREETNNLLPLAQVGGEIVAARLLTMRGIPAVAAAGSLIVDITVETLAQLVFTLIGLGLLALTGLGHDMFGWLVAGVIIAGSLLAAFLIAQQYGLFRLVENFFNKIAGERGWSSLGALTGLHDQINAMYRDWRQPVLGGIWHLAAWILGAGEIWIGFHAMGVDLGVADAIAFESLIHALRSIAFFVPMAAGVQEGAFVMAGALFGISPDIALGMALIKRVRDLLIGVPVLLAWQAIEGRRWITFRNPRPETTDDP